MTTSECQCGLAAEPHPGPTHRYIVSSPECWRTFESVLAREYEDLALFQSVHQLTVDTYAAQHPIDQPAKSLTVHLVALHAALDLGRDVGHVQRLMRRVIERGDYPDLEPPAGPAGVTVADVTERDHEAAVRRWSEAVWEIWGPHRSAIASLAEAA